MTTLTTSKNKIFSFRMDSKIRSRLKVYSQKKDRPMSYFLNGIMEGFFELEDEKLRIIKERVKEMEAGHTIAGDLVMSAMKKWSTSKTDKPFVFQEYFKN